MITDQDNQSLRFPLEMVDRFVAMGIDVRRLQKFPEDPHLAAAWDKFADEAVRDLEEMEAFVGPPTRRQHERRLDEVARLDPRMPPWISRIWQIPSGDMLLIESIMRDRLGPGFSVTTASNPWPSGTEENPLRMMIHPVTSLGSPSDRDVFLVEMAQSILEKTGIHLRLDAWPPRSPETALQGMLAGRVVRDGCTEIGTTRVVNWDAIDNF